MIARNTVLIWYLTAICRFIFHSLIKLEKKISSQYKIEAKGIYFYSKRWYNLFKEVNFMEWFWLALAIGLLVVEIVTTQFVTVWFAASAGVVAIITAIANNFPIYWQIIVFVVLSVALLFATRPLVKKLLRRRTDAQKTNLDLLIDNEAIVVEEIENISGKGAVKLRGTVWSAKSEDNQVIKEGEIVIFKRVEGNKAIVAPKKSE